MIEVSLYMHPELRRCLAALDSRTHTPIANSVLRVMQKHINDKAQERDLVVTTPIYFQIRTKYGVDDVDTLLWFVGALGFIKVLDNYYMAYLVGDNPPLVKVDDSRDYLTMEKKSQAIYSRCFVPEPMFMQKLAYETPSAQLSHAISLTY